MTEGLIKQLNRRKGEKIQKRKKRGWKGPHHKMGGICEKGVIAKLNGSLKNVGGNRGTQEEWREDMT